MKWRVKLVSTDFDGTIFDEFAEDPVAVEFQELIAEFQADGGVWVINTGRDQASLLEELARRRVRVRPDYLVVVEREIYKLAGRAYQSLEDWNRTCSLRHQDLARDLAGELPAIAAWIRTHTSASVFSDNYSPLAVVATSNAEMDAIGVRIGELSRLRPEAAWMRNDVYARLCHADYSKGSALLEIQRILNLDPGVVFAMGDHLNDLAMLDPKIARYFAVPKNAVPQVIARMQELGGRISEYPCGHAVANELEKLRMRGSI